MIKNKLVVKEENLKLIDYLIKYSDISRNKIKAYFKYDNIKVNNEIKKYDYIVKLNDVITITDDVKVKTRLNIIFEDDEFIVVNKPAHLITVGNKNEKSLYNMALDYMRQKTKKQKPNLFVLHRIDMETSGIVIFCKNRDLTFKMQKDWNKLVTKRLYTLVVEKCDLKKTGHIELYLKDNENTVVTVTDKDNGSLAITDYKIIKENKNYSMIEADIKTGRKNQIRVSFSHLGYPIVGDKKYYSNINPIKRLALVANKIEFINPMNNKKYLFEIDIPKEFNKLV